MNHLIAFSIVFGVINTFIDVIPVVESFTSATACGPVRTAALTSSCLRAASQENGMLLTQDAYDTILSGRIAVIPNFLPPQEIATLRADAQWLHGDGRFSTDALASYGTSGYFDPAKDRAVLRLNRWKDTTLGNWEERKRFGNRMSALRSDLSYRLHRPNLARGVSVTGYGDGSTEISYTRFGPGAFLKRHVDEHHEELKGKEGWSKPTRRSVSWLIYLNDKWDAERHGGQLRCYERLSGKPAAEVGARSNGDLQIGWLRASALDPVERPVFLDARRMGHTGGNCAMYIDDPYGVEGKVQYVTRDFFAHPILFVAGGEVLTRQLLIDRDRRDLASRFHFIEPPKSAIGDLFGQKSDGTGERPGFDESPMEVEPNGGTLVLFDSVSLPHEVLATRGRERWATSGWFHEDQQAVDPGSHIRSA